jgi:ATP-dependent Clp protease ATP-binding subunit ClpB
LLNKQVFSLNLDALSAGAKTSKEFVARWLAILTEAAATEGQIILFVDQLHQFVGTYANQVVSAALRDALKQGQLRVVGAATSEAYAAYISADESLTSLFQTIRIDDEISKGSESGKRGLSENENSYCADKAFVGAPACASRGDELHRRSNEDPSAFEELTIDLTANQLTERFPNY